MAKRRRKKPNIPEAALQRAREQADMDETSDSPDSGATDQPEVAKSEVDSTPKPRRRRRDLGAAQLDKRKHEGTLDGEYVADLLANPTKVVTEEDLHADYAYVLTDLRNMGILAAVLFVVLIGMALIVI